MMADFGVAPQPLREFIARIIRGGAVIQAVAIDSPINQLVRLPAEFGTVEILADRGQWFVRLAPRGSTQFFDVLTWIACVTESEVSLEQMPLEDQLAWLDEFLDGDTKHEFTIECLLRARRRRAFGRLGMSE